LEQGKSKAGFYSWKEALIVFLVFAVVYGITARGQVRVSDEIAVFGAGISLAEEGNLEINNLLFVDEVIDIGAIGRGGNLYAKYPPGSIFVTAILYSVFSVENDTPYILDLGLYEEEPVVLASSALGAKIAMMGNVILGAIGIAFLFLILRRFYDMKTSVLSILLIGFSTNWWFQSRGYLSELGAGSLMVVSLYFASVRKPYRSALSLGFSMLFRPTNVLAFPIWIISFWDENFLAYIKNLKDYTVKQHFSVARKTYLSGIMIALFAAFWLFYNWWRHETFFEIGYEVGFSTPVLVGMLGVLFSPICSIFLYSPITLLTIPGMIKFYKTDKAVTLAAVSTSVFYIITISKWAHWDGGFNWGERFLVPILLISSFFVAPIIEAAWKNKQDFILIGLLAVFGLSMQLSVIARDPFWVMVNALENNVLTWDEAYRSLDKSWIALQFKSLPGWRFHEIDAWLLRALFGG